MIDSSKDRTPPSSVELEGGLIDKIVEKSTLQTHLEYSKLKWGICICQADKKVISRFFQTDVKLLQNTA